MVGKQKSGDGNESGEEPCEREKDVQTCLNEIKNHFSGSDKTDRKRAPQDENAQDCAAPPMQDVVPEKTPMDYVYKSNVFHAWACVCAFME